MHWIVEHGIGEDRALLMDGDAPVAARLRWKGELNPGDAVLGVLAHKTAGERRGLVTLTNGDEVWADRLPPNLTEGRPVHLRITRTPMCEPGRVKRAQGRFIEPHEIATKTEDVFLEGDAVRRFDAGLWEEIWDTAASGAADFGGGSLLFSVTPAMTLIDVDGAGDPRSLALAAVPAIARWLRLFDLGGSIGIDFPTLAAKADRKAVDAALSEALTDWPHERTAMNGFGFVQLIARLERPSLLHRFASARTGLAARKALRMTERVEGAGKTLLTVHPALKEKLKSEWLAEAERRTGRPLRIETDPALAIEAAAAQIISHD